ncbi:Uncharacterized protein Fot_31286 [Forsythia ovata]|uniref:Uncharacterized protein n=1 Tax=Forsythia ovata TaxID=205694 RepID=A0ABD1T4K9_9LAMI
MDTIMNISYDDAISHGSSESRHPVESCTFQLQTWRPFQLPTGKNLESDSARPYSATGYTGPQGKRPCRSDRTTSFSIGAGLDMSKLSLFDDGGLDMSKLSLFDDDRPRTAAHKRWFIRKRRRSGSRSLSGRSKRSERDSSPPLVGWDVEGLWNCFGLPYGGGRDGFEWRAGSGPGHLGDAELGYGDEVDEEEDDLRLLFWGEEFGDSGSNGDGWSELIAESPSQVS